MQAKRLTLKDLKSELWSEQNDTLRDPAFNDTSGAPGDVRLRHRQPAVLAQGSYAEPMAHLDRIAIEPENAAASLASVACA